MDTSDTKILFKCIIENNNALLNEVLSKYNANGPIIMTSSVPFINDLYYKYLAFYYWMNGYGINANNSLHIYNRYHFKPLSINDKLETDLGNIEKAFKKDKEFILVANKI